jgi:hypothetical protein
MALHNEILAGRYNRFLQRLLSMKGGPPAPQLASEIQPQMDVEALPVELRFLLGWHLYQSTVSQLASAANASGVQIRNPLLSGAVAVITSLQIQVGASELVDISQTFGGVTADLTNVFNGQRVDSRAKPNSTLSPSSFAPVADLAGLIFVSVVGGPANPYEFLNKEYDAIPMFPGHTIRIVGQTVNTDLRVHFKWRERPIEEGEVS